MFDASDAVCAQNIVF